MVLCDVFIPTLRGRGARARTSTTPKASPAGQCYSFLLLLPSCFHSSCSLSYLVVSVRYLGSLSSLSPPAPEGWDRRARDKHQHGSVITIIRMFITTNYPRSPCLLYSFILFMCSIDVTRVVLLFSEAVEMFLVLVPRPRPRRVGIEDLKENITHLHIISTATSSRYSLASSLPSRHWSTSFLLHD